MVFKRLYKMNQLIKKKNLKKKKKEIELTYCKFLLLYKADMFCRTHL